MVGVEYVITANNNKMLLFLRSGNVAFMTYMTAVFGNGKCLLACPVLHKFVFSHHTALDNQKLYLRKSKRKICLICWTLFLDESGTFSYLQSTYTKTLVIPSSPSHLLLCLISLILNIICSTFIYAHDFTFAYI